MDSKEQIQAVIEMRIRDGWNIDRIRQDLTLEALIDIRDQLAGIQGALWALTKIKKDGK